MASLFHWYEALQVPRGVFELGFTVIFTGTIARLKSPMNPPSRDAGACTYLLPIHQCKGAQATQSTLVSDQPRCQPLPLPPSPPPPPLPIPIPIPIPNTHTHTHRGERTALKPPVSSGPAPPWGAAPLATSRWRLSTAARDGHGPAGLPGLTLSVLSVPPMNLEQFLLPFDFMFSLPG